MKYLLLLFLLISHTLFGQSVQNEKPSKKVTKYINEVSGIIEKNSIYSDSINWEELKSKIITLSAGLQEIDQCRPIIDTIIFYLRRAGDDHSAFYTQLAVQKIKGEDATIHSESRYLGDAIAYLKVPAFVSINLSASESFASDIHAQVKQLDESHEIHGWIVDLRGNTGGNIHPMIKGISCFIGEGIYAYTINAKNEIPMSTNYGQAAQIKINNSYRIKNPSSKIAVLIDSMTASSGELTAIAFKTLPNVQFFGQPSAGFTTSNQTYRLSDGSYLFLAAAYMADRNKKKYIPNILPDVVCPVQTEDKIDHTLETAKKWLQIK